MVRNPIHEPFIHEVTSHQDRDVRLKSSARTVHGKPRVGALRSFPVQISLPSFWKRPRARYARRADRRAVTALRLSPSWKHCLGDFWNTMRTFKSSGKGFHFSRQKCLLIVAQVQSCFFWFVGKVWVCHFDMKQGLQRTRHFEASLNLTVQKHFSANWNETRTCIPHMTVFLRAHCIWRKRTLNFDGKVHQP